MAAKIGSGGGSGWCPEGAAAGSPDEAAAKSGAGRAGAATATAVAATESESPESHARRVIESCLACAMDLSSVAWVRPVAVFQHPGGPLVDKDNATYNDERCQPSL